LNRRMRGAWRVRHHSADQTRKHTWGQLSVRRTKRKGTPSGA